MSNNITVSSIPVEPAKMSSARKTALVAGMLYLLTFVSIPTLSLYSSIHTPGYIIGPGPDSAVITGGILEIIVAIAGIATAVVLYPVLREYHERLALALISSRILEACTMFMGVCFLLSVVTLRQAGAGPDDLVAGRALVSLYDRMFLLGQSFMPAINDLLLGYILFRSRLVPRRLALTGIIGSVPLIAGYLAVLFGLIGQHSAIAGLAALLVALFESWLGIYLLTKGFKTVAR